jgi:type IV pilus assembly protein PilX
MEHPEIDSRQPCTPSRLSSQRGVVVVVSLVLLAVMLILGVAIMRLVTSEERMAAQSRDRALALQAVEAALRTAEALVEKHKPEPVGTTTCTNLVDGVATLPVCPAPAAADKPRWDSNVTPGPWTAASSITVGTISLQPDYFAEHLGSTFPCGPASSDPATCKRYRITARVAGDTGRASVMAQTIYATD